MTDHLRPSVQAALARLVQDAHDTEGLVIECQIVRAELERQAAEIAELRALLDDPGTTHSEGCWNQGKRHYVCARRRIEALTAELAAMRETSGKEDTP